MVTSRFVATYDTLSCVFYPTGQSQRQSGIIQISKHNVKVKVKDFPKAKMLAILYDAHRLLEIVTPLRVF